MVEKEDIERSLNCGTVKMIDLAELIYSQLAGYADADEDSEAGRRTKAAKMLVTEMNKFIFSF